MWTCETCGKAVRGHPWQGDDAAELLGRRFFGLAADVCLCPGCLGGVRSVGATVCELAEPGLCSACRARVERAWASAGAHPRGAALPAPGAPPPGAPPPRAPPAPPPPRPAPPGGGPGPPPPPRTLPALPRWRSFGWDFARGGARMALPHPPPRGVFLPFRLSGPAAGYLSVAAAALLWASSGVAGKALFEQGVAPLALVQLRVTLASGLLLAAFTVLDRRLLGIRWRDVGYFAVLGGGVMAAVQTTYFFAISKIHVAAAILLQYTAPLWVAAFAAIFWRERLTGLKAASLAAALAGAYLVVGAHDLDLLALNRAGVAAGLISGACFAAYSLLGERGMHRYSPWTVLFYALAFATPTMHVLHPPFHFVSAGYTGAQWLAIGYVAVAGTLLPFGLYFVGVNHIRSTRASIAATLEPIAAAALAFLFLGEALSPPQTLGGALVLGAVVLLNLNRETSEHAPAAVRARRAAGHGGPA